jgi:hypothetical protein
MKDGREGIMPRTLYADRAKKLAVFRYIRTADNIAAGDTLTTARAAKNAADYPLYVNTDR